MYSRLSFVKRCEARDIGMVKAGHELDLAQEAGGQILASGQVGKQDLHGFDAVGDDVADLVDLAHTAGAQLFKNLVVADSLAGLVAHV